MIVKMMDKGKVNYPTKLRIPVNEPLQKLTPHFEPGQDSYFRVDFHKSSLALWVKDFCKLAGIEKDVHFHVGRHTFAVNSLMLGMRMDVLASLMGHSSIVTTEKYYAKIVDKLRNEGMNHWQAFGQKNPMHTIHCQCCGTKVLEFPKGSIRFPFLDITCTSCGEHSTYEPHTAPMTVQTSAA